MRLSGAGPLGLVWLGLLPRYCVTAELVRLRLAAPSLRDLFRAGVAATFPWGEVPGLHRLRPALVPAAIVPLRCPHIHAHYNYGISQWYYASSYKWMFVCTCLLVFVLFTLVAFSHLLTNLAVALMLQRIRKDTAHAARGHDKHAYGRCRVLNVLVIDLNRTYINLHTDAYMCVCSIGMQ